MPALILGSAISFSDALADGPITHLYDLANFSGVLAYGEVRVHADRQRDEVYVSDGEVVRVFNASGMETFWFGLDPRLGSIRDLAVDEAGDIYLLAYDFSRPVDPEYFLTRCNYRGEPVARIRIEGLPESLSHFAPNVMAYRGGSFLLVSRMQMLAASVDRSGRFQKAYDLGALAGVEETDRASTEIFGFSLDREGSMRFTVPVLFKAFVVTPDGRVAAFGKAGSAPGMFGIVSGIAADEVGNTYVADRLHSVVMVFDRDLRFVSEFGYRGNGRGNLVSPSDLAIGASGKLYVTQGRKRGVSVFSTIHMEPGPDEGQGQVPPTVNEHSTDMNQDTAPEDRLPAQAAMQGDPAGSSMRDLREFQETRPSNRAAAANKEKP